jgi:two-component system chemotaxis sensor kinase CheA
MEVVQALVDGTDRVAAPRVDLPAGSVLQEAPASADPAPRANQTRHADEGAAQASVKVDTRKLDNLVDMVGELVIAQAILQEDPALLKAADERLTRNLAQLKRITSDLQKNAMSMRMVPIRQTFQKMARLVRDLSKKSGKAVDLVLSGEDTELDRRVVEDINDPLMHMVRNSVDHGIEDAARRTGAGKRPEGRLALSAYHQGGNIVIAIADDGAGLDTERILAKAVSQGLVQPGETLPPSEIHQLIFQPGFSTAEVVTEISGRGVGMDVVRRNIDALRGRIEIQSTPGQGTTFLIKLPLTLAILDGLLLGVGSERFVMPTFAVRESLRPVPEHVHTVKGRPCMIQVRDKLVPLVRLSELYGIEARETDICRSTVVVIEDDGHQVGLVVDQLLGKQEVVIKTLGETFGQMAGVAGGAILGDGRVGLILDAHGIVGRTRGDSARAA